MGRVFLPRNTLNSTPFLVAMFLTCEVCSCEGREDQQPRLALPKKMPEETSPPALKHETTSQSQSANSGSPLGRSRLLVVEDEEYIDDMGEEDCAVPKGMWQNQSSALMHRAHGDLPTPQASLDLKIGVFVI